MSYLLWTIFIVAGSALYLSLRLLQDRKEFDKVVLFFFALTSLHGLYAFFYQTSPISEYLELAFPFGLIYGPLFYFALKAIDKNLSSKQLFLTHMSPFLIGVMVFLAASFSPNFIDQYSGYYHSVLYSLVSISLLGYVISAFYPTRKLQGSKPVHKAMRVITGNIVVLILGFVLLAVSYSELIPSLSGQSQVFSMLVFSTVLFQLVTLIHYQIQGLRQPLNSSVSRESVPMVVISSNLEQPDKKEQLYEKSLVADSVMDLYEKRLRTLEETKMYRDMSLSLDSLASKIDAPKHHLTQLLNVRMDTTFTKYINGLRVAYARRMLRSEKQKGSMQELAYECGFNSRVSFYRNFKNITGKSPSEYRKQFTKEALPG